MAEQIAATVLKIGTAPLLQTPQDWSFPTKSIAMEEVIDGDINTAILYNGVNYYVSETLSDLETAANAGGGGGSSYLSKTYAELAALIAGDDLVPGTLYKISDRGDRGLFFQAISVNQLAKDGTRLMLCPSFYGVGASGGNDWIGVWNITKSVNSGDLAIWGGLVWENQTSSIGTSSSDIALDGVNWSVVPKSSFSNDEYVELEFGCIYDIANDWIERQWDSAGNVFGIDYYTETNDENFGFNPCDVTDWNFATDGNNRMFYNNRGIGVWNNSNDSYNIEENNNYDSISNNSNGGKISVNNNLGLIRGNSNSGAISYNTNTGAIRANSNNGEISYNTNGGTIQMNSGGTNNGMDISGNTCAGYIDSNSNDGNIRYNTNGGYIGNNANGTFIEFNSNSANINDNSNDGKIQRNSNNGNIFFNENTGGINNNSNLGDIRQSASAVTNIQYNKNNGDINNNSNVGSIEFNNNNGEIVNCASGVNPCNIFSNVNNGYISGTFAADVTDTAVNKS